MRKLFLAGFILILYIACDREELQPEVKYPDNIIAGQTTGFGIKYSDILNDTLFFDPPASISTRSIDLNGDGIDDFELNFEGTVLDEHQFTNNIIIPIGKNAIATSIVGSEFVDTISSNEIIDKSLNWSNDTCIIYNYDSYLSGYSFETGLWNNVKVKYAGAKIFNDDKILYGWIRLKIYYGWNLILIDYASTVGYKE